MTDITSTVKESGIGRSGDSLGRWVKKTITPVDDSVSAIGTHEIITIPANNFVAEGYVVITTSMASTSGTGTFLITLSGVNLHTAIQMDGSKLVAGDVIGLSLGGYSAADGLGVYKTTADTVDLTIASNPITGGVFDLIVRLVDLIDE